MKKKYADDLHIKAKNYPGSEDLEVNTSCSIQISFRKVQAAFKGEILLTWKTNYFKVSVLGVVALGGHFARLCNMIFMEHCCFSLLIFKKKRQIDF